MHQISDSFPEILTITPFFAAISLIGAFISGAVLVCSIIGLREANKKEQEAEEKILQANEVMDAASKHVDFNEWVMRYYPSLKDDFLKENSDDAKARK